ncbi:MAG: DUF6324 family protein [Paracoccaceae bacterium]|nr:DUF6324 family protein [Paracoccaceae bacterium]
MSINDETEVSVDLQVGPTSLGMVRLYLVTSNMEIPMDFTPEEADEIAEEIKSAAQKARETDT